MKYAIAYCLTAILLSGAACTKNKKKASANLSKETTLRYALGEEPPTLDWTKATDTTSATIIYNIMDTLLDYRFSEAGAKLSQGLVHGWLSNAELDRWTFELREDVEWSDGVPLTVNHVIDGFERLLNPKTGALNTHFYYMIKGARAYNTGKVKDFSAVGIERTGEYSFEISLNEPVSYFPHLMTLFWVNPIRKDIIDKYKEKWTEPENIVTLGAYKLAEWKHDESLILRANPKYFRGEPDLKNVLVRIMKEEVAALNLFDTGKLDVIKRLPNDQISALRKRSEYHNVPQLSIRFIGFNLKKNPVDNKNLRKALALSIDRQQITTLLGGGQEPNTMFMPHGLFAHSQKVGLKKNVELARKLFNKDSLKDPKILFSFPDNESNKRVAENLQAQWEKALGLRVQLHSQEWKTYLGQINTDPPMIYALGWLAIYPDPSLYMSLYTSSSHYNRSGWSNKKYDQLVARGAKLKDPQKRSAIYQKASELLLEDAVVVVPLYTGTIDYLVKERVKNFPFNPIGREYFRLITL